MTEEVRKDVIARKLLKNVNDYKVCNRCGVINEKSNSECWRCEFKSFNPDVEEGIDNLVESEWDIDEEELEFRYVDVGVVEDEE